MADQKAEKKRMDQTFGEVKAKKTEIEGESKIKVKDEHKEVQAGKALL